MKRTHLLLIVLLVLLACLLTGCVSDADRYKAAQEKLTAGDYAGAITAFTEIEKYEDSSKYIMYIKALQSVEAGDLETAITGFTALGDFSDSSLQANYYKAYVAEGRQDYETAMELYALIPGYRDASSRLAALPDMILDRDLAAATTAMQNGNSYQYDLRSLAEKEYTDPAVSMKAKMYALAEEEKQAGRNDTAYFIYDLLSSYEYSDAALVVKQMDADALYDQNMYARAWDIYSELDAKYHTHDADYQAIYDSAAALVSEAKYDEAIRTYQALGSFSDCEEKAKETYAKKAEAFVAEGKYDEAIVIYKELGDYSNCAEKVTETTYQKAVALAAAGKYDEAIAVFTTIKDYQDSTKRISQAEADQKFANGDYAGAWLIYSALDDEYHTHDADYQAMYDSAVALAAEGKYDEAILIYKDLGDYSDSAEKVTETTYQKAVALAAAGKYDEAIAVFTTIKDYQDSAKRISQAEADQKFANGDYAGAWLIYSALEDQYHTHDADYQAMYDSAIALASEGKYDDATAVYTSMGNYGDSEEKVKETTYQKAKALASIGDLEMASAYFTSLGDYEDSALLAKQTMADHKFTNGDYADAWLIYATLDEQYHTHDADYQAMYEAASSLVNEEKYDEAIKTYESLGTYSDSTDKVIETTYLKANALAKAGEYQNAIDVFTSLGEYADSVNRVKQTTADQKYANNDYAGAWLIYAALDDQYHTHDAEYEALYANAAQLLINRDYEGAKAAFISLGTYTDAAARADQVDTQKAIDAFTDGDYANAALFYSAVGDTENAQLSSYKYAEVLKDKGEYLAAAEEWMKLQAYSDSRERRYQMALEIKEGHAEEAVTILAGDIEYSNAREELYQIGIKTGNEKHYAVSVPALTAVGAYKDAAMKLTMNTYAWGGQLYENGEYDKSAEVYSSMGDFSDAPTHAKEAAYAAATEQLNAGNYVDAKERFTKLGDYLDSKTQAKEADYRYAMGFYNNGSYTEAKAIFVALGNYSDSVNMAKDCDYIPAKALYDAKQYSEVLTAFKGIAGFKDSDTIMNDCRYQLGKAAMASSDYTTARDWFDAAGTYSDSKAQANECRYQLALTKMNEGKYDDAIAAFTAISGYSDSKAQISACYNAKAATLEADGSYEAAYAQYAKAGNTSKMQETAYLTALVKLSGSDYESAIAWYEKAGTYSDAKEQILSIGEYYYATQQYDLAEAVYVKVLGTGVAAQRLYELGQYYELVGNIERGAQCYREAGSYEDAPGKATELEYQVAESLYIAKDWKGAKVLYAKIPGYKDVDSKITACDNEIATAVASAAARAPFTKVGNIVTYGHYEQDNNTSNGKEAIEWIVLKYDSTTGNSLLISRYGLDAHRFDASKYQGWDKSVIRTWLNGTFLNVAFTSEEQKGIVTTKVSTPSYNGHSGGSDTQDKLWLLSLDEATTYFTSSEARKCTPTTYAVKNGAYQSSYYKLNGTGCCWWWLRSPGYYGYDASDVFSDGSLDFNGVSYAYGSIRPAFWLNLDSAAIY